MQKKKRFKLLKFIKCCFRFNFEINNNKYKSVCFFNIIQRPFTVTCSDYPKQQISTLTCIVLSCGGNKYFSAFYFESLTVVLYNYNSLTFLVTVYFSYTKELFVELVCNNNDEHT